MANKKSDTFSSIKIILLPIVILLFMVSNSFASPLPFKDFDKKQAEEFSTLGREFIFGFPFNYKNSINDPWLSVVAMGEPGTRGVLRYYRSNGSFTEQAFTLNAQGFFEYRTNPLSSDQEIRRSGVDYKTFHLIAEEDVSVFLYNHATYTSESTVCFPVNTLGNEYYIMSYPANSRGLAYHASQFLIVATEDATTVEIEYSAEVDNTILLFDTIRLDKNQSYFVKSRFLEDDLDLTGTVVNANKPLAVFGSHERALITDGQGSSYDYLLEMLPPKMTWANEFFFVPFPQPNRELDAQDSDLYRISAIYDDTEIYKNGELNSTIDADEELILELTEAGYVESSAPIFVTQFKKSNWNGNNNQFIATYSDPLMVIVPPKEQFLSEYDFYNANDFDSGARQDAYQQFFISIVIRSDDLPSLRLDGRFPDTLNSGTIPSSDYIYTFVETNEGAHQISADAPFGLYVYGYGAANSYGHIGGQGMKRNDYTPPQFTNEPNIICYGVEGYVAESSNLDTYITQLTNNPAKQINTLLVGANGDIAESFAFFDPSISRVDFSVKLDNEYEDGYYNVEAFDARYYKSVFDGWIKGFTVGTTESKGDIPTVILDTLLLTGEKVNYEFTLENYGRFLQTVNRIDISSSDGVQVSLDQIQTPFQLRPDEQISLLLELTSEEALVETFTITLQGECSERMILDINVEFVPDQTDPEVVVGERFCYEPLPIIISDVPPMNKGIREVNVSESVNIDFLMGDLQRFGQNSIQALHIDPYEDAYYELEVSDFEGNTVIISDTLPGFTLKYGYGDLDNEQYEIKDPADGCGYITIVNTGILEKQLREIDFDGSGLAIPPSYLPMTINSQDSVTIPVCREFYSRNLDEMETDIFMGDGCLQRTATVRAGELLFLDSDSTLCGTTFRLVEQENRPYGRYIVEYYPNPAKDYITLELLVEKDEYIFSAILMDGTEQVLTTESLEDGFQKLELDISMIPNGNVLIKIESSTSNDIIPIVITR
ncbi:MAG: hypothetical protein Kapaf2KO_07220 [Candidatus Kapaibacteriales bacterium]